MEEKALGVQRFDHAGQFEESRPGTRGLWESWNGFEQERGMNRYFAGLFGRPPEKQQVIHTHMRPLEGRDGPHVI